MVSFIECDDEGVMLLLNTCFYIYTILNITR
jgi:hypothetical protein